VTEDRAKLDCLRCPSLCCKVAGYVEVSDVDINRLARHLGLTRREFVARHIVHTTRAGKRRIKTEFETCQFLDAKRRCTVYEARPTDCRGYFCWEAADPTLHRIAEFLQTPIRAQQEARSGSARTR
jgi:hypothetical protein